MKRNLWAVAFAMFMLGILLTKQYRVTQLVNAPNPANLRAEDVARELTATKNKLRAIERDNTQLRIQVDKLIEAGATQTVEVPKREPNLELLAGTVAAKGKGIIVSVAAADALHPTVIKESYLWWITQELKAAGAEGIAINGQRLTTATEIDQVPGAMMINGTMTGAPYEVAAVGDPHVLETALRMPYGVVQWLTGAGLHIQIVRSDAVALPSYGAPPEFQYLMPLK